MTSRTMDFYRRLRERREAIRRRATFFERILWLWQ